MAKPGLKINIYSRGITQTRTKSFSPGWYYQPGLKIYLYSRLVIPARTKNPCPTDDRWAGTFSPSWYYEPGLKGPLVSRTKNVEANAKLGHRSKVCSLVDACVLKSKFGSVLKSVQEYTFNVIEIVRARIISLV